METAEPTAPLDKGENQDEEFIRGARLVSKLEAKFQAEIQNMGENHVLRGPGCLCLSSTDSEPYRVSTYSFLLSKGLVGLRRTVQLQLLQH